MLADGLRFQKPTNAKPETVSGNTKHDTKMEQLNLNKSNPEIEFKLNSEDSYLM
ncbi:MAG: hypothetical protein RL316_992, partial [Bacteroidota bacterium]